jgi:hypothetical protein
MDVVTLLLEKGADIEAKDRQVRGAAPCLIIDLSHKRVPVVVLLAVGRVYSPYVSRQNRQRGIDDIAA